MAENSIDNKTADKLISHLQEMRKASHLQIHRKEISAWAATVLYLGILALFSKVLFPDKEGLLESIIMIIPVDLLVIALGGLFSFFVFLQYSGIHEQNAFIRTYDGWIYDLLAGNTTFNFTMEGDETFPTSIMDEKKRIKYHIRQHNGLGWFRCFLPIKFVFWKIIFVFSRKDNRKDNTENYTNVAVQEGVIYDVFILSTFFFVGYSLLTKFLGVLCNLMAWFIDFL